MTEAETMMDNLKALRTHMLALWEIVQAVADLEPSMLGGDSFSSEPGYRRADVDPLIEKARALLKDG